MSLSPDFQLERGAGGGGEDALYCRRRPSVTVIEGNSFLATCPGCALRKPERMVRISCRAICEISK